MATRTMVRVCSVCREGITQSPTRDCLASEIDAGHMISVAPAAALLSRCNCSICSAKGALYVPVAEIDALRVTAGESDITSYQFGTKMAVHYFCKHCGIHTFHRPRIEPNRWSVTARCVEALLGLNLPIVDSDGQNWESSARDHGWSGQT